jgi:hypothetical protein
MSASASYSKTPFPKTGRSSHRDAATKGKGPTMQMACWGVPEVIVGEFGGWDILCCPLLWLLFLRGSVLVEKVD